MQQNSSPTICLTKQHLQILQCIDTLFTRWSLRKNTYFFKHMKSNLQLPLFIIAQERRISQITQSQAVIVQALKMSQFVEVNQQARSVRFVELNTIRVADQGSLIKVQKLLKEYIKDRALDDKINVTKPPEYIISTKTDDGYYYITFKQKPPQNPNIFSKIVEQYNKKNLESPILFSIQPMYEDIKQYITKIRKSKQNDQQRYNNKYSNNSYNKGKGNYTNSYHVNNQSQLNMPAYNRQNMMMYPNMCYTYGQYNNGKNYGIFIRKAVESQDEYQNETKQEIKNTKANQQKKEQQKTQQSLNQQKNTYPQTQPQQQRQTQYANTQQNTQKYKKYESKQNNKDKIKKSQPKNNKNNNKIVFDDNDFPTIG